MRAKLRFAAQDYQAHIIMLLGSGDESIRCLHDASNDPRRRQGTALFHDPVFGIRGATYFLGVAEWLFGALLLAGFWNKKAGILGALGLCFSMLGTSTIIPFIPGGWAASAGGFPAMFEPKRAASARSKSLRMYSGARKHKTPDWRTHQESGIKTMPGGCGGESSQRPHQWGFGESVVLSPGIVRHPA